MTWRHGLFVHWPVDPEALRTQLPDQVTLETRDGQAWLSVLPFVLTDVGIRRTPSPFRTAFAELNVRTYVRYRGDPGLFFFSIDIGSSLVATLVDLVTRLPVSRARMRVSGSDEGIVFSSTRLDDASRTASADRVPAQFAATYRPDGPVFTPEPETLAYWLVERRRFYAPANGGVLAGEIAHEPWPLQPATVTIHENTLFAANDLPTPAADPVVHFCDELSMTGSILRRLS